MTLRPCLKHGCSQTICCAPIWKPASVAGFTALNCCCFFLNVHFGNLFVDISHFKFKRFYWARRKLKSVFVFYSLKSIQPNIRYTVVASIKVMEFRSLSLALTLFFSGEEGGNGKAEEKIFFPIIFYRSGIVCFDSCYCCLFSPLMNIVTMEMMGICR